MSEKRELTNSSNESFCTVVLRQPTQQVSLPEANLSVQVLAEDEQEDNQQSTNIKHHQQADEESKEITLAQESKLLFDNCDTNRVKVYYESKEVGQHELRLKYIEEEPSVGVTESPVVFFVDILGGSMRKIDSHEEQIVIDEVSNKIDSTKFNVSLVSSSLPSSCLSSSSLGASFAKTKADINSINENKLQLNDNDDDDDDDEEVIYNNEFIQRIKQLESLSKHYNQTTTKQTKTTTTTTTSLSSSSSSSKTTKNTKTKNLETDTGHLRILEQDSLEQNSLESQQQYEYLGELANSTKQRGDIEYGFTRDFVSPSSSSSLLVSSPPSLRHSSLRASSSLPQTTPQIAPRGVASLATQDPRANVTNDSKTRSFNSQQTWQSSLDKTQKLQKKVEEQQVRQATTVPAFSADTSSFNSQFSKTTQVPLVARNKPVQTYLSSALLTNNQSNTTTPTLKHHDQSSVFKNSSENSSQVHFDLQKLRQSAYRDTYSKQYFASLLNKPNTAINNKHFVPINLSSSSSQPNGQQRIIKTKIIRRKKPINLSKQGAKQKSQVKSAKVNSIKQILKKPFELVKNKVRQKNNQIKQPITLSHQLFINNQQQQQQQTQEDYKFPINHQKQVFSSSKRLYLLPARDYFVNLATKSLEDLEQKFAASVNNKQEHVDKGSYFLTHIFGSHSLRRPTSQGSSSNNNKQRRQGSLNEKFGSFSSQLRSRQKISTPLTNSNVLDNLKAKVKMPSGKSDKATIVDNKDGTIKISYEPKEIGQHELTLRYNDETLDEGPIVFYVDIVGGSKKKITAYGSGLSRGVVGDENKFCINTGGLGSAKLSVTIDGPSKTNVNLNDNKDGTITVSYSPSLPGEYKIKISFDGKQVVGSPFSTIVRDEGRTRVFLDYTRGNERSLNLKVSEDDLKTLSAIVTSPCGLEEPCALKLLANGQLGALFTPREQGDHLVNVKKSGNHIAGSPFKFDVLSRDVGDARQVKVSGKGIKEGSANGENEIIINTKDAGYGHLSVCVEGPGKVDMSSKDGVDGQIKVSYKPSQPGCYSIIIKYADHVVPGSPFTVNVLGKGLSMQKETIRKFRKAVAPVDVNTECHFNFKMPNISAYDLSAKIRLPSGNSEDVSVKDKGDFEYQVSFTPKENGIYGLSVKNKDIHILGSPFPFTVGPFLSSGHHRVRCGGGTGLIRGFCKKLNEFDIFTREAGAGELCVIIEGVSKPSLTFTDRKDGSCHVGYTVDEPGEYKIHVLFNDCEVPDSPFRAYVQTQTGDVAKIELGPLPPDNMIMLNKPCNLTVIMNGAKGNIDGKVRLPDGKFESIFASPIDESNWGVRFIPRQLGVHQVHIMFNKGSAHIPQSPVFIRVGHDKADPAEIVVVGHGLKDAIVNHATDFTVDTCAAGHALLEAIIDGPARCPINCVEVDEGYRFNYTPLAPGEYYVSIKYNGSHIAHSPFKAVACKQPGSKQVSDIGSHEVSYLSISTTDREAKQKVEHMPKFKSDASRVYCKGMGLKKAFANKPNTLTVNCSEAGFNMISASFLGPTRNTIHNVDVKHMGGSIYQITYVCKDKGDAILLVKYGDEQIPGSPFRLEVS